MCPHWKCICAITQNFALDSEFINSTCSVTYLIGYKEANDKKNALSKRPWNLPYSPFHIWCLKWGLDIIVQYIFAKHFSNGSYCRIWFPKKSSSGLTFRASFAHFYIVSVSAATKNGILSEYWLWVMVSSKMVSPFPHRKDLGISSCKWRRDRSWVGCIPYKILKKPSVTSSELSERREVIMLYRNLPIFKALTINLLKPNSSLQMDARPIYSVIRSWHSSIGIVNISTGIYIQDPLGLDSWILKNPSYRLVSYAAFSQTRADIDNKPPWPSFPLSLDIAWKSPTQTSRWLQPTYLGMQVETYLSLTDRTCSSTF